MPPNKQDPYNFILNAPKPKRSLNIGGSKNARIAIVVIGFILLVLIGGAINSFLKKDEKAQTKRLTEIAKTQSEIIRVSALSRDKAKVLGTRVYGLNTNLSMNTSQQQVKQMLNKKGVKAKGLNKTLAASKNPKNDVILDEGEKNNRFDETFTTLVDKQLTDYQKQLKVAYSTASSKKDKAVLEAAFENAEVLKIKPGGPLPKRDVIGSYTPPSTDGTADDGTEESGDESGDEGSGDEGSTDGGSSNDEGSGDTSDEGDAGGALNNDFGGSSSDEGSGDGSSGDEGSTDSSSENP